MHDEDGPSLSLGQQLCRSQQSQNVHFVFVLRSPWIELRRHIQHYSLVSSIDARGQGKFDL